MTLPAVRCVRTAVSLSLIAALLIVPSSALAAKKKPILRIQTKTFKVTVAEHASGNITIPYEQRTSNQCAKRGELAVAMGITNTKHHLASSSFGPAASSAFVVGPRAASSTNRLQVLCVRNAKVTHRRSRTAKLHWGQGTATATVQCPKGYVALGNALTQEFSPGFGAMTSLPGKNARSWTSVVGGLTQQMLGTFQANNWEPVYADAACAKVAKRVVRKKTFTLDATGSAHGPVTCTGGRRALGWGIELNPYQTRVPNNGGWITPVVQRAQLSSSKVAFRFGLPGGVSASDSTAGTKVVAHVICGVLR